MLIFVTLYPLFVDPYDLFVLFSQASHPQWSTVSHLVWGK